MSKKNKNILIAVIAAVIIIGLSFFGGMKYGESKSLAGRGGFGGTRQFGQGSVNGRTMNMRAMGGLVSGQIVSNNGSSITLQLTSGGSRTVLISSSTQVLKAEAGSAADLTTGQNISVNGSTNADGSVSAQMIQLRPQGQNSQAPMMPAQPQQ